MSAHDQTRRQTIGRLLGVPLVATQVGLISGSAAAAQTDDIANLVAKLQELEARQQITDVLYRYARGWDRLDEEALRSCFFPDAEHQHGGFKGKSQDFITRALPMVAKTRSTSHMISNVTIEIRGNAAVSECYFLAHHRRATTDGKDEEDYFLGGRYVDRFERRDGEWKIARRIGLNSLERVVPRADRSFETAAPDTFGKRKPEDPWYLLLEELRKGG
ncbi:MAG TPA: nuclear transport factor 2 family protein [Steroidobacteraceae bacterium]